MNQATSDEPVPDPDEGKNPAAVALGRLGGQKGGKARAAKHHDQHRTQTHQGRSGGT